MATYSSSSSSNGRARPQPNDQTQERLIPFPSAARSRSEPDPIPRRRNDVQDLDRATNRPRRTRRRRRQETPWLQRNALSVAAVSVLVALLGLGFGLLQMITRPEPSPSLLAFGQPEQAVVAGTTLNAVVSGPAAVLGPVGTSPSAPPSIAADRPREITSSARTIESNYVVASGDTLGQIAARFNTTVERIQALNNLADPRALRIGTKLVIPPPL